MAQVSEYRRPASLEEALVLLERPETRVIGGGTKVNAEPTAEPIAVVDLQALDLYDIWSDVSWVGASGRVPGRSPCPASTA